MKNYNIKLDINSSIFRGYDIRAIYGKDLNEDITYTIGCSFGTYIAQKGYKKCVIGYDNRASSVEIFDALKAGILSTGINVVYLGLVTTPMFYFAQKHLAIYPGIMITASHNPKEYNGFKMAFDDFGNACGQMIQDFKEFTQKGEYIKGEGKLEKVDIKDDYLMLIKNSIMLGDRKIKAVVDAGNGTASVIIKEVFDMLNIEVIPICCVSDPNFSNHHPDPSVEANNEMLKAAVLENKAHLGIGIDGDGDRVGIIDEKGKMVYIDFYSIIIWRDIMSKVSNKKALFDVKCSKSLKDEIIKLGGIPVCYRTGNSYMKAKMRELNCAFGSELSGHVFFNDRWPNIDDGIYAGLRLIEILSKTDKNVSELLDGVNKYYSTPEIKVKSSDEEKFKVIEKVKEYCIKQGYTVNDIDGVRVEFDNGFALVRASNTGPDITARFEGVTQEDLENIKKEFMVFLNI
ncbi:MAG: phosphomannomutase/phosphoglucomutase [Clostridia bacterium]